MDGEKMELKEPLGMGEARREHERERKVRKKFFGVSEFFFSIIIIKNITHRLEQGLPGTLDP